MRSIMEGGHENYFPISAVTLKDFIGRLEKAGDQPRMREQ
jgi:hypothetical protein